MFYVTVQKYYSNINMFLIFFNLFTTITITYTNNNNSNNILFYLLFYIQYNKSKPRTLKNTF